jgi:hypothetical protein
MVSFWYSSWTIFEFVLKSDNDKIFSFVVGICGQFLLLFYDDNIRKIINVDNKYFATFLDRVYAVICGYMTICFWRFCWTTYDAFSLTGNSISTVLNILQNSLILMLLHVFKNTVSAPFIIITDQHEMSGCNTYLRRSVSKNLIY